MATKKIKTEVTLVEITLISGQKLELTFHYLDSAKQPINISGLEFFSEWRTSKKELVCQLSSVNSGNDTGAIEKLPGDGIEVFRLSITDSTGFGKGNGTLDVWAIDASQSPRQLIPIVSGTWISSILTTELANIP